MNHSMVHICIIYMTHISWHYVTCICDMNMRHVLPTLSYMIIYAIIYAIIYVSMYAIIYSTGQKYGLTFFRFLKLV